MGWLVAPLPSRSTFRKLRPVRSYMCFSRNRMVAVAAMYCTK